MAKDRNLRKKTRFATYESWCGQCENYRDHLRRMSAEWEITPPRNLHKRKKKSKPFAIMATAIGTPKWYMPKGAWVFGRYEKKRDAENALKSLQRKRWPGQFYELRLVDNREHKK